MDLKAENMLDYLLTEHRDDEAIFFSDFLPKYSARVNISETDCGGMLSVLKDNEMVEYLVPTRKDGNRVPVAFRLSYKAKNLEEFQEIEAKNFFKENWIALLALLVSIIALFKP